MSAAKRSSKQPGERDVGLGTLLKRLTAPVDGDLLAYFRLVFGLCGVIWVIKQFRGGAIEAFYSGPAYHFHYYGFEWVEPFGPAATRVEFAVLGVAAALLTLGMVYRLSALVFALIFSHLFLLDKCLYQNHYYLLCVLAWLMCVLPVGRLFGSRSGELTVPRWSLWLLRYQLALPYVFGSVAKWNSDWIAGEPMRSMLAQRVDTPLVGQFFTNEAVVLFFVWGGLLFDLLVVPGLLLKRFRIVACCCAIFFHLTNACLFTIGVFPWFMLFATPLFFPPGTLRAVWNRFVPVSTSTELRSEAAQTPGNWSYVAGALLMVFVLIQAIVPLRHFAIPGNVHWTEEGHCFSWHMLVRGKQSALRLTVSDRKTGRSGSIDLRRFVTGFQLHRVAREPRLILELARYVEHDLRVQGFDDIELRALSLVSLNGRKPQHLIDPNVDLTRVSADWSVPSWIVPLSEPLRKEAWKDPMSTWEQAVMKGDR